MNLKTKVLFLVIGVILVIFGSSGFLISISYKTDPIGRYNDQKPLYSVNGIVVDSKGNLYYGTDQYNSIQVYNNKGAFLYRFSLPNAFFTFYIDSDDIIHVASARANGVLSFKDGELMNVREYMEGENVIPEFARLQKENYYDDLGNRYYIYGLAENRSLDTIGTKGTKVHLSNKTVNIYDPQGTFISMVSPKAPIWPFSIWMFWGIAAVGLLIIIFLISGFHGEEKKD